MSMFLSYVVVATKSLLRNECLKSTSNLNECMVSCPSHESSKRAYADAYVQEMNGEPHK